MLVRIKKGKDGPHSLVCIRSDGSHTMQHHPTGFFPVHDLTHFAVEMVMGYRRGFYGLLEEGWNLSDFGTRARNTVPGNRKQSPEHRLLLTVSVGGGAQVSVTVICRRCSGSCSRLPGTVFRGTGGGIGLYALPPGETIELTFTLDQRVTW